MEIKKTGLWFGRQAVRMCLMVLLVSILAFGLLAVSPIDPLQTNVGQTALGSMSPEQIERLRGTGVEKKFFVFCFSLVYVQHYGLFQG